MKLGKRLSIFAIALTVIMAGCKKDEILHIGDNYKADYLGAMNFGFKALHINNQQYTLNDITRHLQKND